MATGGRGPCYLKADNQSYRGVGRASRAGEYAEGEYACGELPGNPGECVYVYVVPYQPPELSNRRILRASDFMRLSIARYFSPVGSA